MTCFAEDDVTQKRTLDAPSGRQPLTLRRPHALWTVTLFVTAFYVLFTIAVHLRLLDSLDVAVGDAARPGGVWGTVQVRAARVVEALEPAQVALSLLLVVAVLSLVCRSFRPFAVMALVGVPVVVVTLGTKWAMAHWETGATPVSHGSFPSGHMASAVAAAGIVVLLLRPATRWGWMLPVAMGCVTGSALVLASVHPTTDVIGGGLVAAAALTGATAATLGQWASNPQRRDIP